MPHGMVLRHNIEQHELQLVSSICQLCVMQQEGVHQVFEFVCLINWQKGLICMCRKNGLQLTLLHMSAPLHVLISGDCIPPLGIPPWGISVKVMPHGVYLLENTQCGIPQGYTPWGVYPMGVYPM